MEEEEEHDVNEDVAADERLGDLRSGKVERDEGGAGGRPPALGAKVAASA